MSILMDLIISSGLPPLEDLQDLDLPDLLIICIKAVSRGGTEISGGNVEVREFRRIEQNYKF
jgi:hypothetical protein